MQFTNYWQQFEHTGRVEDYLNYLRSTEGTEFPNACCSSTSVDCRAEATNPFAFGTFRLYEGRTSYTISEADIQNFFPELLTDYIGACYGMYFAEVADFYCRENNDEREMLKLVYQSLRALCAPALPNELVRSIFELKAIAVNGEYPGPPAGRRLEESTLYALSYIAQSPIEKLYTFTVSDKVLDELKGIASEYRKRFMDRSFKSLEILKTLC